MLIGHEGIATALTLRLRERGASTARLVEKTMGLPANAITTPADEDVHPVWMDVVSKGRFPTWMVMAADTPLRRTAGESTIHGDADETHWRYPFMVTSHVVGNDEREVALHRYRLMLVVRVLLIQDKILLKTEQSKAIIETGDMQEVVGGQAQQEERYLMEGRNEFHVASTELIPALHEPQGSASSIQTAESLLSGDS